MKPLKYFFQRIKSNYSRGVHSDDIRISDRHIYDVISSVRALLYSQKSNKKQKINQWAYQTLHCIELIKVPENNCPCRPMEGCKIYRSKHPIPMPISDMNKHLIESVTTLNGAISYSEESWKTIKYLKGNKYTANKKIFFIKDGYLYVMYKTGPTILTMTAIFKDVLEAAKFNSYCTDCSDREGGCTDCESNQDKSFHLDPDLEEPLIEISYQELIEKFRQNLQDNKNNSKDDASQNEH